MIKKLVATTIAVMAMQSDAVAAASDALMVAHPQRTLLTDISYTGQQLVAVGKHGTIVTSKDGKSWQQATVPVQSLLTAVTFASEKKGWACGHDATILNTEDGGQSWQIQQHLPEIEKPCLDITFADEQTGYAVGAYGMMYETTDGGKKWTKRFIDAFVHPDDVTYLAELKEDDPAAYEDETAFILPHFNALLIDGSQYLLAGEMGLFAISDDAGKSWRKLPAFYAGSLFSINKTADGRVVAAGLRGNAFVSNSDLSQFQRLAFNKTATINHVLSVNDQQYLFANSGVIHTRNDAGLSTKQLKNGKSIMAGVLFEGNLVLATEQGIQIEEAKH
ncbi:WD40/YVTN/BNR-like repeat-containing protein [Pseudoalteromonas rubra]|uniref:WD40/YVTN/BNR-like repeat-containing protein n=1 Tax=Pseudoalteromonas rubra TaxID=43658 RepID=UPI000F7B5757|nr:YCF48-related protein [Pseudoalteromonas rubra]